MHEFSFFLLKNWLPVGIAAIVFFLIGLLIAKFIWGRYAKRLSFAVEENLNLASQWSALGLSQRDLFKKLRARWQADRDAWEGRIAETEDLLQERESRIAQLTSVLEGSGKELPAEVVVDEALRQEVRQLKAQIDSKDAEIERLNLIEEGAESISPILSVASEIPDENAETRIQDLEQDLIDTHDELHRVREDYLKQVALVESLEAKLIDSPGDERLQEAQAQIEKLEQGLAAHSLTSEPIVNPLQFSALLAHRSSELLSFRKELKGLRSENQHLLEATSSERTAFEELRKEGESRIAELETAVKKVGKELDQKASEVSALQVELEERDEKIGTLQGQLADAEILDQRRQKLQADLNDAHHEMYDVRRALRERLEEIELLEGRLEELDASEEEAVALAQELKDTRHEMSDVRIGLNEKTSQYEEAKAQMEELEAIIEDRGAEVNDLSDEVRQQRDQIRILKETLAETEGELEALSEESSSYGHTIKAKETFLQEQTTRIADLEASLAQRYVELNEVRGKHDDESIAAKQHASRASHLEAELERRTAQFDASDNRITTAEQQIDAANEKIAELTEQLASSDQSIVDLQREVETLSRDKDETIRNLERATRRIEELEEAARLREERIAEINSALQESSRSEHELQRSLEKLNSETEEARRSKELIEATAAELEASLGQSDSRTLELSKLIEDRDNELEFLKISLEKSSRNEQSLQSSLNQLNSEIEEANRSKGLVEATVAELEASLGQSDSRTLELSKLIEDRDNELESLKISLGELQAQVDTRDTEVDEARAKVESTRTELEEKLEAAIRDEGTLKSAQKGVASEYKKEIELLQAKLSRQEADVEKFNEQRRQSVEEIERLRSKVAKRGDSIRELQSEVSNIMMQRAARDNEISMLKDKLRAVETELNQPQRGASEGPASKGAIQNFEEVIQNSLSSDLNSGNGGTSLDDLEETGSHHAHIAENAPAMGEEVATDEDDNAIYFDETSAGLNEVSLGRIDEFARSLRKSGRKLSVTVIGFSGSEGTSDYIESLSAKRADAVRERLLERGVPQSLISVEGSGQDRRFSNWRARRVELVPVSNAVAETVN